MNITSVERPRWIDTVSRCVKEWSRLWRAFVWHNWDQQGIAVERLQTIFRHHRSINSHIVHTRYCYNPLQNSLAMSRLLLHVAICSKLKLHSPWSASVWISGGRTWIAQGPERSDAWCMAYQVGMESVELDTTRRLRLDLLWVATGVDGFTPTVGHRCR